MDDRAAQVQALPPGDESVPASAADAEPVRLRPSRRKARWPAPLRWLAIALSISGGLGIVGLIAALVFVARLEKGPILVEGLGQRISQRLQERFGASHQFRLGRTMIERGQHGPELTIDGLSVTDIAGNVILAAPKARVSLDPFSLVVGDVTPKRLDVVGLELRFSVMPDGALAISAGTTPVVLRAPSKPAAEEPPTVPEGEAGAAAAPSVSEVQPPPSAIPPSEATPQARSAREAMRPAAEALRELLGLATGKGSPLGGLGQFGIVDGKLIFEDRATGRDTVFEGLDIRFDRSARQASLLVSVNGPNGRWQMSVAAANDGEDTRVAARTLDVEFSNLSLDEITLFSGLRDMPFDLDTPIRVKFSVGVGQDGEFRMAKGSFGLGAGYFALRDQDQEPFLIERVNGTFRWDDDARRFVIEPTQIETAGSSLLIAGEVVPPQSNNGVWAFNLASIGDSVIGPERPGESALPISKIELRTMIDPQNKSFDIERVTINGPQVHFSGAGNMSMTPEGRRFKFRASAEKMPFQAVMRLWPSASGAQVRAWLMQNLKGGTLTKGSMALDYNEEAFAAMRMHVALPDEALRIEFDVQDATLAYLPGVQPARGLSGQGVVTGKQSRFTIAQGHVDSGGRQIAISGGTFASTNMAPEASPASVTVSLNGQVDTLAGILGEPGLKQHAALVLDPTKLTGRFEGKLTVDFKVGAKASSADVRVRASANATNVSIDNLMGKERLEGASIQFSVDGKDLTAKGNGRLFGSPAAFSFEKVGKGDVQAVMSLTIDDQARQKMGWSTGSRLTGPVALKISGPLSGKEPIQGDIELDLTRAAIGDFMPGLGKPAGRAAKATFRIAHRSDGMSLQGFTYQAGSTSIRGTVDLDKKGGFQSATLSSLKLSPGDEVSGSISASGANMQVTLQGPTIDMRPFIQTMTSSRVASGESGAGEPAGRLDFELQSRLATGYNRQAMADFSMKMTRQAGRFSRFELSARTGRSPLRGRLVPGTNRVEVTAGDGGAVMSFLDLYKRMEGGGLTLSAQVSSNRIDGILAVQNFVLRDEPALRRLVAEGVQRTDAEGKIKIDPSLVNFERLRLNFTKDGGRIQLHDGIISGPNIGTTLEGMVDFPRDQVNMKGTFVPAYGLNNMFAKIPLFGPILGGGRNEGLLGVNFSVSGKASAPVLNVNPLSAIAPGFLRKIFGAVGSIDNTPVEEPRPPMPLSLTPGGR